MAGGVHAACRQVVHGNRLVMGGALAGGFCARLCDGRREGGPGGTFSVRSTLKIGTAPACTLLETSCATAGCTRPVSGGLSSGAPVAKLHKFRIGGPSWGRSPDDPAVDSPGGRTVDSAAAFRCFAGWPGRFRAMRKKGKTGGKPVICRCGGTVLDTPKNTICSV